MTKETVFALDNVSFGYDENKFVLEKISFDVNKGDFIALLGANGTGKSTLLKILDGLIFPNEGKISFLGKDLSEKSLKDGDFKFFFRKEVAFLFQNSDVQLFCSTVEEELSFTLLQLGLPQPEIEKRVIEIAKIFDIIDFLPLSPHKLSEGEKKKIAFASLLPQNPSVFLLDELTSNLDPKNERFAKDFLKTLHNSQKTLICATHDLDFAKSFADKIAVIGQNHNICAFGETKEVLENEKLLLKENII